MPESPLNLVRVFFLFDCEVRGVILCFYVNAVVVDFVGIVAAIDNGFMSEQKEKKEKEEEVRENGKISERAIL